jgi:hypothetical protein
MDLRIPSGWFFLLLGIILLAVSFTAPVAPLTDVNVNLYTGLCMGLFGGILLWLARKRQA